MRLILPFLFCAILAFASDRAQESVQSSDAKIGIVCAYGVRIDRPYVFSRIGSDTLRLNGYSFSPNHELVGYPIMEYYISRLALEYITREISLKAAIIAREKTETYSEQLRIQAKILNSYTDLVEFAHISPDTEFIFVKFKYRNDAEIRFGLRSSFGKILSYRELHEMRMAMFWRFIKEGGMVAFGKGYKIYCPHQQVPKTLKAIHKLKNGETLNKSDIRFTALENELFYADVKREINRSLAKDNSISSHRKVPQDAIKIAQDHLDLEIEAGSKNPESFIRDWCLPLIGRNKIEDFSRVQLGKPYKQYTSQRRRLIPGIDMSNLDSYATFVGYGFPITYDNHYIGTITVLYVHNDKLAIGLNIPIGSYVWRGREYADQVHDEWVINARKKYPENEGYQISVLKIWGAGRYIICCRKDEVVALAPTSELGAKILALTPNEDGSYPFVTLDQAEPRLRSVSEEQFKCD